MNDERNALTILLAVMGFALSFTSCYGTESDAQTVPSTTRNEAATIKASATPTSKRRLLLGKQTFEMTCAACHQPGVSGAPKLGDKAAWTPRLRKGKQTLVQHALSGYGYMPAKGGNALLHDDEVVNAVEYMLSEIRPR